MFKHYMKIPNIEYNSKIVKLLSKTNQLIGGINELLYNFPTPDNFMRPMFIAEATSSSRIEGTKITFKDALKIDEKRTKSNNYNDVFGYMEAIYEAQNLIKTIPISVNMLKRLHQKMFEHATYDQGQIGEFRNFQVYIGVHKPPKHQEIENLMNELIDYINNNENNDTLVTTAISHAQFEFIHPFGDGNGRIGRILISLILKQRGITKNVDFFMSEYFEKNKLEYYKSLEMFNNREFEKYLIYFLYSMKKHSEQKIHRLKEIYKKYSDVNFLSTNSKYSHIIKNFIFQSPVFSTTSIKNFIKKNNNKISKAYVKVLDDFVKKGYLTKTKGKTRRANFYYCDEIIDLYS